MLCIQLTDVACNDQDEVSILWQRVNGRIAMWGFAAGVAAELGRHESIVQQAAGHPFGVTFFMLLISVASIMPKFASGVPIGMHASLGIGLCSL